MMPHIPKNILKKSTYNPNARDTQNYSIVEDLAQAPCAMSTLEVLQTYPAQRKAFLATICVFEKSSSGLINFDTENHKTRLPYHVTFEIKFSSKGSSIHITIIDEGASTCMMSLSCWKALKCLELVPSSQLLKAFDGHTFKPHRIIPDFLVELGGKIVLVEVEVVDAPIDYNLLLGWSWTHAMTAIVSTMFRVIFFPHEGKNVTIDQLDYFKHDLIDSTSSTIPMISNSEGNRMNLGVGMYTSLMGSFDLLTPNQTSPVFAISQVLNGSEYCKVPFQTNYLNDSWTLPNPNASTQGEGFMGMKSLLSATKVIYLELIIDEGQIFLKGRKLTSSIHQLGF